MPDFPVDGHIITLIAGDSKPHVYVCLCMYLCVYVCLCMYLCVFLCVCVCVCMCVCVCLCVCVCVCVANNISLKRLFDIWKNMLTSSTNLLHRRL